MTIVGSNTHPSPTISFHGTMPDLLTSADTYVDIGTLESVFSKTTHFRFKAVTNNLDVKILASIDGGVTYPIEEVAEFQVTVGTDLSKTVTTYYTHLKVQVKPSVAATHGTLSTNFAGANF